MSDHLRRDAWIGETKKAMAAIRARAGAAGEGLRSGDVDETDWIFMGDVDPKVAAVLIVIQDATLVALGRLEYIATTR